MTNIVFLISMPRSGSTLLQKVLSKSPDVASTTEPWIMLPFWGMRQPQAMRAVYDHQTCAIAIDDFVESIENGEMEMDEAIRLYANHLYTKAACGKRFFLDKTPRYFLEIEFLKRIFPEAYFIILVRNPISVFSSLCETFQNGRFVWLDHWVDWIEGQRGIARAIRAPANRQITISYEQLALKPEEVVPDLCRALGIDFKSNMVSDYQSSELRGRLGDPTGIHRYTSVSIQSLEKWKDYLCSSYRRNRVKELLKYISDEDLNTLGYPRSELHAQLDSMALKKGIDLEGRFWGLVNTLATWFDFRYIKLRYKAVRKNENYACGYYRKTPPN